jgi:hypothetical protein
MSEWISVDGYENMPVGTWLTWHESRPSRDCEFQVTTIGENGFAVSGNLFTFDLPRVTHYMPLPEPPTN